MAFLKLWLTEIATYLFFHIIHPNEKCSYRHLVQIISLGLEGDSSECKFLVICKKEASFKWTKLLENWWMSISCWLCARQKIDTEKKNTDSTEERKSSMSKITGEWVNDDRIFYWKNPFLLLKVLQRFEVMWEWKHQVWLVAAFQNIWLLYRDLQLAKYLFTLGSTVCLSTYPLL